MFDRAVWMPMHVDVPVRLIHVGVDMYLQFESDVRCLHDTRQCYGTVYPGTPDRCRVRLPTSPHQEYGSGTAIPPLSGIAVRTCATTVSMASNLKSVSNWRSRPSV